MSDKYNLVQCPACNGRFMRLPTYRCCGGRGCVEVLIDADCPPEFVEEAAQEAARKLATWIYPKT